MDAVRCKQGKFQGTAQTYDRNSPIAEGENREPTNILSEPWNNAGCTCLASLCYLLGWWIAENLVPASDAPGVDDLVSELPAVALSLRCG